jgi:hypothetical protein
LYSTVRIPYPWLVFAGTTGSEDNAENIGAADDIKNRASAKSPDFIRLAPMPADPTTIPCAFHPNAPATKTQVYDFTAKVNDERFLCLTLVCAWAS